MNATLINTTANHAIDHGDRLQAPLTPRRKLQIPIAFATGNTPGKISKEPYTPGKLKIPAAFTDLKTLKTPSLDDSVDCKKELATKDHETAEQLPPREGESSPTKDDLGEQLPDKNDGILHLQDSGSPGSKPKRKIRKQRSKKLTVKKQLLAEIAALEKEIHNVSSVKLKPSGSSKAESRSETTQPSAASHSQSSVFERKDTGVEPELSLSTPQGKRPETVEPIAPSSSPGRVVKEEDSGAPPEPEVPAELDRKSETRELNSFFEQPRRVFNRKDSGADDSLVVLESESSDPGKDEVFLRGLDVGSTVRETVIGKVDATSIQSPRTKTKTLKKLRSFFRRTKSRKNKSTSRMNATDCLV